jgi:hypothetical protein
MAMMGSKSFKGVGTSTISVECAYKRQNDTVITNTVKSEFTVKCHKFFNFRLTDYHGPT